MPWIPWIAWIAPAVHAVPKIHWIAWLAWIAPAVHAAHEIHHVTAAWPPGPGPPVPLWYGHNNIVMKTLIFIVYVGL
jgi:hypothetical protein